MRRYSISAGLVGIELERAKESERRRDARGREKRGIEARTSEAAAGRFGREQRESTWQTLRLKR